MQEVSYITSVERVDNKKSLIVIDESLRFSLYQSEVRKFELQVGEVFSTEQRRQILSELLPARARQRVLYMLRDSDKSEADVRAKLAESYYPQEIIDDVVDYMKKLGYIDDMRYARQYIMAKNKGRSVTRIRQELYQHGVERSVVEACFDELDEEEIWQVQSSLIRKEFFKKRYDFDDENIELKNKIISSLLRKGFRMDEINRAILER